MSSHDHSELVEAKNKRAGIIEQRPCTIHKARKGPKPYEVWVDWGEKGFWFRWGKGRWFRAGRYANYESALQAFRKHSRDTHHYVGVELRLSGGVIHNISKTLSGYDID